MLEEVCFQNFKSLKDVRCELSPLTVIVGPNASGKTSVLEGMHYLSQLASRHTADDVSSLFREFRSLDVLHSGDGTSPLTLGCKAGGDEFEFEASLTKGGVQRMALGDSGWHGSVIGRSSKFPGASSNPLQDGNAAARAIKSMAFLHLEASKLARPSYTERETPRVESSGVGLATVIAHMKLSAEEDFEALRSMMQRIVPQLTQIRIVKKKIRRMEREVVGFRNRRIQTSVPRIFVGDALLFDFVNRKNVPATNISEGTLLALGLLTVLHSPARPRILLLDDIEKGFHPRAQKELVSMLREILQKQAGLQIVATSHSPYFLDFLSFDEVRVMVLDESGYSLCGRLERHPKFAKWKDELAPGEMWSLFGENWIAEGEKQGC